MQNDKWIEESISGTKKISERKLGPLLEKMVENDLLNELGNNINSKILAFAFSLSAEIERNMISQRTKEALARRRSEGMQLGRPKGSLSKLTKLTGKED